MSRPLLHDGGAVRPWEMAPILPAEDAVREVLACADPEDVLAAARAHAEELLQSARSEADRIVCRAREEAEELRAAAWREGFSDGKSQALDECGEERKRLRELRDQLGAAYARFCESQVPALAQLAAEAAEALIFEQLTLRPERVVAVVREALRHVTDSARVTVRLHPDDVDLVSGYPALCDLLPGTQVQISPDPAIERGGCRIESDQGEIDATMPGRLSRLAESFAQVNA